MNNVLIYFCANVQILIRPGTIVFTKSDLTPDEKRRISPRFDHAPGARSNISPRFDRTPDASPVFFQDSTAHPARGPAFLQDSTAHPTRAGYLGNIQSTYIRYLPDPNRYTAFPSFNPAGVIPSCPFSIRTDFSDLAGRYKVAVVLAGMVASYL